MPILLVASLLASGCATTHSDDAAVSPDVTPPTPVVVENPRKKLPFPAAQRASPTVTNVVGYADYRDPLIYFNRAMFAFNDVTYRYVLIPVCKGYLWVMPNPVEKSVDNFFVNIKTPIVFVNHLLQLEPKQAGVDVLSFCINSTVGLLGLFDPATAWFGVDSEVTHVDDTLADYSIGYGFYLVLPVLGPSDARNSVSIAAETFMNPIPYLVEPPASTAIVVYDGFQYFAPSAEDYNTLRLKTDDPYIFFRNLYLQGVQRDAEY